MNKVRIAVAALALSASGFIGMAVKEGYTDKAIIPTKGDVPTLGFGSTRHEDGKAVTLADKTDPVRALIKAKFHIEQNEASFRASLDGAYLTQQEYDVYMDFVYQFGIQNWNQSSMRKHVLAGRYLQACQSLLAYKYSAGFDCSTPGNKVCWGVWERQQDRYKKCLMAQ